MAKSVESASNLPMPLMLLPFFGSGFAPTESMPEPVRWFADHQPFTPLTESVRGLLLGSEIGSDTTITVLWATAIAVLSYLWARDPVQPRPLALTELTRAGAYRVALRPQVTRCRGLDPISCRSQRSP
ncbi:MAG: ABC transporter permease [Acidimicrobiales bacterium]